MSKIIYIYISIKKIELKYQILKLGKILKLIKDETIFLLGGYDLEMQTIKKILIKEDIKFFDHQLRWGAKLSSYKKQLEEFWDATIYGIELIEDITPPPNYKRIDHHNDFSDKEASIIQVLELLNKRASREQLLIAHNDVGYIEAMESFGATEDEIKEIRQRDRATQGVTTQEELHALEEIEKIREDGGLYFLNSSLNNFSPIVDNFQKRPFLIYSKKSLTYYGDIDFLKEQYKKEIEKNQAYHGREFFGFDKKYLDLKESEMVVKEIIDMQKEKKIISYHNFMFPFRFDKIIEPIKDKHEFYRNGSFDNRVKIDKRFRDSLHKDDWEYQQFKIKNSLDYNEIVYFHDFVKDSLFNTQEFEEGATSYYFEKKIIDDKFELKIEDKEPYILKLEGVNLRLFDTGVGILSFEVENYNYHQIDDILKINDYGRRVYPQFLGDNFSTEATKGAFLPEYIIVNGIEERFGDLYKEIKLAKYIVDILGESFTLSKREKDSYFLQPIIDDRMFLLCWYGDDSFVKSTQKSIENQDWYRYVFVDGQDITVQDKQMHREFIDKATYRRWNNYGTFYGITRYSFMVLSNRGFFGEKILLNHVKTIYFQMVTLLLVQRASILRFSDEITAISDVRGGEIPSVENISILYKNYLRFVNKLYFKEVTAQDQGIELYDKAIDILNIKRDIEDLRQEIGSLNSYAFLEQEREEKEQMNQLTRLGTFLIPPTLVAGFFGMNVFGKDSLDIEGYGWLLGAIVLTIISPFVVKYFTDKEKK